MLNSDSLKAIVAGIRAALPTDEAVALTMHAYLITENNPPYFMYITGTNPFLRVTLVVDGHSTTYVTHEDQSEDT